MKKRYWFLGGLIMAAISTVALTSATTDEKGKFVNSEKAYETDASNLWEIIKAYTVSKRQSAQPNNALPLQPLTASKITQDEGDRIYRLGHSTILMKLDGKLVLTDPVLSERASPVQWAGPKRFHPSPISIDEMPQIDIVVISHDHYDHLDKHAVLALAEKVKHFVTPLKVGQTMVNWGVDAAKITELDWWESVSFEGIEFVATPAQHFSGRGLLDRNQTLWASWVIDSGSRKLFFSGDSGYFSGFKQIGDKYGPFDVTMVETGAYNDLWSDIHMMPEHSLQAHLDLRGQIMMPIHNGTFDLSLHDWFEPLERIQALAKQNDVTLLTPVFGQSVSLDDAAQNPKWWREPALGYKTDLLAQSQ